MTSSSREPILRILITYLKLTSENQHPTVEKISEEALVGKEIVDTFLREYELDGEPTSIKRVKASLTALKLGVEGDRIARYLHWREFEELSAQIFKEAGYMVFLDTRVIGDSKRYQIDLIAYSNNLLLVVDCKHWVKPPAYTLRRRIVSMLENRIKALMKLEGETQVRIIPVVLTLYHPKELIVEGCPYVPVRKISGFIDWLENNYPHIRSFKSGISLGKLKESSRKVISKWGYE